MTIHALKLKTKTVLCISWYVCFEDHNKHPEYGGFNNGLLSKQVFHVFLRQLHDSSTANKY